MDSVYSRPLLIVHGYWGNESDTYETRCRAVTERLMGIKARGFGGVVADVSFTDYTLSEPEWKIFGYAVSECKCLGLRLWIYDENGYPSGGAGGMTVDADPDYEAIGVVMIPQSLAPGETKSLPLPQGHMCFLDARVFASTDGTPEGIHDFTPTSIVPCHNSTDSLTLTNNGDQNAVACVFAKKRLYEGTHAVHNVCDCRRYIDVTNPDAVHEFLNNTYEKYRSHIGEYLNNPHLGADYPGIGTVEAVFTDEPSLMGCYINAGLYPPHVHDKYDESIPLYPVISWGRDFENEFYSRCGYSPIPGLIYKFAGSTKDADKYRLDFHNTMSGMYEKAFFSQISDWCARNRVNFSGHILLEDDIRQHTLFEGNFFSLLRHMHYPGIDMLQSIPEVVFGEFAFTPKLVSSVAHMYGRRHVMSEVSAHAQGGRVTPEQFYASLCLQYAFGVDVFTSYYGENFMETGLYSKYNAALCRIDMLMSGENTADALLYYPIETFFMHHLGSDRQYGIYTEPENVCAQSLKSLMYSLIGKQIDFDFTDCETLSKCRAENGRIISPSGHGYSALLLPAMEYTPEMYAQISRLRENGVRVLSLGDKIFENNSGATVYGTAGELTSALDRSGSAVGYAECDSGIAMLCRDTENGRRFMFVNSEAHESKVKIKLNGIDSPVLYCPFDDRELMPEREGDIIIFTLKPYGTLICK